jgi:hypothetical protein
VVEHAVVENLRSDLKIVAQLEFTILRSAICKLIRFIKCAQHYHWT